MTDGPENRSASMWSAARAATAGVPSTGLRNGMSVDVEDYFQVSAFDPYISRSDWDTFPSRVEANTDAILALFDQYKVSATFFTLGWVAERFPGLVRRIADQGHEIASHGWGHQRVSSLTRDQFHDDVWRARHMLEDVSGHTVKGYRAPSYSISKQTPWAHEVLAATGHRYSSSVAPIRHDHYGIPDAPRFAYPVAGEQLLEIPVSTVRFAQRNIPCGGGGWFRLYPYALSARGISRINREDGEPAVFYFHPWEIDPDQPRQPRLDATTRFRHYVNLGTMKAKVERLLSDFQWGRMDHIWLQAEAPQIHWQAAS